MLGSSTTDCNTYQSYDLSRHTQTTLAASPWVNGARRTGVGPFGAQSSARGRVDGVASVWRVGSVATEAFGTWVRDSKETHLVNGESGPGDPVRTRVCRRCASGSHTTCQCP